MAFYAGAICLRVADRRRRADSGQNIGATRNEARGRVSENSQRWVFGQPNALRMRSGFRVVRGVDGYEKYGQMWGI